MSTQEQRDELRRKIEESERRNEDRSIADMAREATDNATEFVKAHPILTVSVVALVGLAIGSRTSKGRELTGRAVRHGVRRPSAVRRSNAHCGARRGCRCVVR